MDRAYRTWPQRIAPLVGWIVPSIMFGWKGTLAYLMGIIVLGVSIYRSLESIKPHTSGIDYCTVHHGTRNEDQNGDCDWRYHDAGHDQFVDDEECNMVPLVYIERD